jgi:hypothetical protein
MAKRKKKAGAAAAKSTANKKAAAPAAKGKKRENSNPIPELDFSTARPLPKGDKRMNRSQRIVTFLVDDVKGNERVYTCMVGHVPAEAQKALEDAEMP